MFKDVQSIISLSVIVYDYIKLIETSNELDIKNENGINDDEIVIKNLKIVAPD